MPKMAHELLERAAKLTETARALYDEYEDKTSIPTAVQQRMDLLLGEASKCRRAVEREVRMKDMDSFLQEPSYKDEGGVSVVTKDLGHGEFLTERERLEGGQKAFFEFVRKGKSGVAPEMKAALVEDGTGQLLVPVDYAGTILRELPREAVIRSLATVRPTTSNQVDIGVVVINAAGWGKLETQASPVTPPDGLPATPADKDTITVHDLNALVKLGRDELADADDNLAEIIRQALSLKIAEQEDDAFAAGLGNGSNQPVGIATNADVTQGVAAAANATVVATELKSVMFKVPAQFRRNAVWLGHSSAEEKIALLQDNDGRFLWQPSVAAGEPATLFGKRWYTVDGLPAMGAGTAAPGTDKSVIFGDVRQGYMIADRQRLSVQRLDERYAEEGKVGLLFTHRVGGDVIRPKAFAAYKL